MPKWYHWVPVKPAPHYPITLTTTLHCKSIKIKIYIKKNYILERKYLGINYFANIIRICIGKSSNVNSIYRT